MFDSLMKLFGRRAPEPAAAPSSVAAPPREPTVVDDGDPLASAMNAFGLDLWRKAATGSGNTLLSPGSLWLALAMTCSGARSTTRAELTRVLHWPANDWGFDEHVTRQLQTWNASSPEHGLTVRVVNRLFADEATAFAPDWLAFVEATYVAAAERLPFRADPDAARQRVNAWVEERTASKIRNLLPQGGVDAGTRLVLVNAAYLLARWTDPFKPSRTAPAPFTGASRPVPMMQQVGHFRFGEFRGVKVLELPYEHTRLSMVVVLPSSPDGLASLEAKLTPGRFAGWVAAMQHELVRVSLPRFELTPTGSLALKELLVELGMPLAFDRAQADFTAMSNPRSSNDRLVISKVFHQAFIRVDEAGTEAAAASGVSMMLAGGRPRKPKDFTADHPFLFFVRDNATGAWLFMGRYAEPTTGVG